MMWIEKYLSLYRKLGFPDVLGDLLLRKRSVSIGIWETPPYSWGFPPALLPLWSDGSLFLYQGYWKHWFVERSITMVEIRPVDGLLAVEVARNFSQLARLMILLEVSTDDEVSERVRHLAEITDVDDAEEIFRLSNEVGDYESSLKGLPSFRFDLPASLLDAADTYHGDFPIGRSTKLPLTSYCQIEFSHEHRGIIREIDGAPDWFLASDQYPVFLSCVKRNDLGGAWMSLNSTGWSPENAIDAMKILDKAANNPLFSELTGAWISAVEDEFISY